jgi:hypothetical protein
VKNQYFGDINDYRKYGLLRCLSDAGMSVGVCWMLTPPDGRSDGNKINYLTQPAKWRHRDPPLFDTLKAAVNRGQRHVRCLEHSGLLPHAKFHSEMLFDDRMSRAAHFRSALHALDGTDVLFFDPDTGLEVSSVPYGRTESGRYLYWQELEEAGRGGASLVLFQHWKRENRVSMAARLSADLVARLPSGTTVVPCVHRFRALSVCLRTAAFGAVRQRTWIAR